MIQGGKRRVVCNGECECGAAGLFEPGASSPATRVRDASQARRLLAIAAVLDGAAREEAAKVGGMENPARLGDPVQRSGAGRPDQQIVAGRAGKLSKEHKAFLGGALAGPRPDYAAARGVRDLGLRRHGLPR
jgi:hypothetical protein